MWGCRDVENSQPTSGSVACPMEEPNVCCHPFSEECCLQLPETIILLVALIIAVQLVLKLFCLIFYYLWYLLGIMFGMFVVEATEKPKFTTAKANISYIPKLKQSIQWSDQDVRRHRRRRESASPSRRCLHCTLEPLKVTMNLQNEAVPYQEPYHHRHYIDCPVYLTPHYHNCPCEGRPRPRRASAPSAHTVAHCQDAACGSSDPIVRDSGGKTSKRKKKATAGTGEAQHGTDAEHPGTRKPAKVYIYPVHPQTPPGSRSSTPERHRRRRSRRVKTSSQEEQPEQSPRTSRRKSVSREAEQQTPSPMTLRYHTGTTNLTQTQTEAPTEKPRYFWSDQVSGADWVYQPAK